MTLATPADAVREYAWNHGETEPDQEWLLHDFDVWVRNPHYTGKPGPHPEEDEGAVIDDTDDSDLDRHNPQWDDDIPF